MRALILASLVLLASSAHAADPAPAIAKAKAEIWGDPGKFSAAQDRLKATLPKLVAAADTGDKATLKAAFGETAGACKNCHDSFRAR